MFLNEDQFRKRISTAASIKLDIMQDKLPLAIDDFLLPYLGKAQLLNLKNSYDTNVFTALETELLDVVQRIQAYGAYYLYLDFSQLTQSNSGLKNVNVTNKEEGAKLWQMTGIKENLYQTIHNSIEKLLSFLEENHTSFPLWTSSEAYSVLTENILQNATQFNKIINIESSRLLFAKLKNLINEIETMAITEITGLELYTEIVTQSRSHTLTNNNKLLVPMIKNATAFTAFADALETLPIVISGNGAYKLSQNAIQAQTERTAADLQSIGIALNNYRTKGKNYMQKLSDYLCKNADTYPLYKASAAYTSSENQIQLNDSVSKVVSF
jgi:hypothetical protein